MTQAYQPPQPPITNLTQRDLPIQRPSAQTLARRALQRLEWHRQRFPQAQGIQPQGIPSPATVATTTLPAPLAPSPTPSSDAQPAFRSTAPPRIQIDWQARLAEARQRLAQRATAQRATAQRLDPKSVTTTSPPRISRAGSALSQPARPVTAPTPSVEPSPVSRQSKFSHSIRRRAITTPVIRTGAATARLQVPNRMSNGMPWPAGSVLGTAQRIAPQSGSQLYAQRLNALRQGQLYTQMPVDSFYEQWSRAAGHPSYDQWKQLLALEARAAGRGKGGNNLTAMLGDSLSQWFPADHLPGQQIWLNQSISGDTTTGILQRLSVLKNAQPDTIYLMAGVNDLKRGATDRQILRNIHQILSRLRQQHPKAQIVVQSILPTRSVQIPNARIAQINPMIQQLAQRHGVDYLDLHPQFRDWDGAMRSDLTTDGIHLSPRGYQVWQVALQRMDQRLAQRPRTIAQAQALREKL